MTRESISSDPVVIHPFYGPAIPSLNWVPAPRYLLRRDRVLRHLEGVAPCRVLDIGCGPGALISELAAKGFDAVGVDESAKARELGEHLQRHHPKMALHASLDPAWEGTFDILCSFEVVEHIHNDVDALKGWRKFLRPNGKLILSTPAHPKRWNAADEWAGHVRRYTRQQLEAAITSAGFEVESVECYGFPLANAMEVVRARAYGRKLATEKAKMGAEELTADSGSDRSVDATFWPVFSRLPAQIAMQLFGQMQRPFLGTGLGNGFIAFARAR